MTDMKWHRGFAFHHLDLLLRQSVLLPPNVQPTPLQCKIHRPTLPAHNGTGNQANNRNSERKRGDVGRHDCRPSDAFGLGMNRSRWSRGPASRARSARSLCGLRRKVRWHRVQLATVTSASLVASVSTGSGQEAARVMSQTEASVVQTQSPFKTCCAMNSAGPQGADATVSG
jgi:hypothetical protein